MKSWQLGHPQTGPDGYVYYCVLCDEVLVLSAKLIDPRKILLVFDQGCPGCGFDLHSVLGCEASQVPEGRGVYANPKCTSPDIFLKPEPSYQSTVKRSSSLDREVRPCITTGIEQVDRLLVLRPGQLVLLEGEASHDLSLLLCARAPLPPPLGLGGDVIFLDGGNLFDTYSISHYSMGQTLETDKVLGRVHLSRAFTYHQLSSLITEKLPRLIEEHDAKLAVVSDITQLYCDPDVREKEEAVGLFKKNVRFLSSFSQHRNILIIATILKHRNIRMENALRRLAQVFGRFHKTGDFTQLTVPKHPFKCQEGIVTLGGQALLG